jgi:signal transduction histidine kinase
LPDETLLVICQGAAAQVARTAGFLGIDVSAPPPPRAAVGAAQLRLQEALHERSLVAELARALALLQGEAAQLALLRHSVGLEFQLQDSLVLLPDAAGRLLVAASFSEAMERLEGFAVTLDQDGAMADAVHQRRLICSAGAGTAAGLAEEQLLRAFQSESLLCLPLLHGDQCLGLLVAGLTDLQVPDLQARERLLLALAGAAATSIAGGQRQRGDVALQLTALREEQALQARKVAHEINNPLAIVRNYLGVLDDKLSRNKPVQAELALLGEEIDRVGSLVNAFAGVPGSGLAFADINQVITRLERLLHDSAFLPEGVELRLRLPQRSCLIRGEADTLHQILLNLVKNSVEALPQGGRIQIVNQGQVQRAGKPCYVLMVSDNGPGIPAEQRSRLFTPVSSSKPGSNRGIGLSIVQELVGQLGGSIHCTSSSSNGTVFDICLPVPETQA